MNGICGRILEVDLTRRKHRVRPLEDAVARAYLGGRGLAGRLLWEGSPPPGTPALAPDAPLVFATGPLTGFPVPGASRTAIAAKSPATGPRSGGAAAGGLALGLMPGHFAVELKYAGYDALVIRGKAAEPVSLVIRDEEVEFRPSRHLWGREVSEAEKALRSELPKEPFQTVLIGPAGERLHPLASAVHNYPCASHAGRGGLGAVLGSKNLKAVAVRGTLHPFEPADHKAFEELGRRASKALEGWNHFETWRRWGTAALAEGGSDAGLLATRNFREGTFPAVARVGSVRAEAAFWIRSEACFYCPLHCRKVALVRNRKGDGVAVAGPELETSAMLGANCGAEDLAGVLLVKRRCDELGLDPASLGNLLGFLMEAGEKRLALPSELGNTGLAWGKTEAMLAATDGMVKGEGRLGQLGQGVRAAAKLLGGGSDAWAMEVKGLEMDTYNPPALPAMVIAFGTSPLGGAHETGHSREVQDQRAVSDSLGLCRYHTYAIGPELQAALLQAVTGEKRTVQDLVAAGERIWNLERGFLAREGFGPEDDRLPRRSKADALTVGPRAGAVLTAAAEAEALAGYYGARGWDPKRAAPLPATLQRLGLADVADALKAG